MAKVKGKGKFSASEEQKVEFEWTFIGGKQVRIKKSQTIEGISVDEYIEQNADPIWLHQNGLHYLISDDNSE